MGFLSSTGAGAGFILIGAWEAVASSTSDQHQIPVSSFKSPDSKSRKLSSSCFVTLTLIFLLSFLFILNSLISFFDALKSRDRVGSALQLQVLAVASLFLLYSVLGLLKNFTFSLPLPASFLGLVSFLAFVEEFLLFYLQRKDPSGIENRYYDLMLLPIGICIVSVFLEFRSPNSIYPRLARGIALVLQGLWFMQMGFSFFTNLIVHGCFLNQKSLGNYTLRCKGHHDYHRGRAIATLQFNCHLALMVILVVGVYAYFAKKNGIYGDLKWYRPIGAELQSLDSQAQFTLDSDDDDDDRIKEENAAVMKGAVVEMTVNGNGSQQLGNL